MRRKTVFTEYRERMISKAGIAIFISGNKEDTSNPSRPVVSASGMEEEVGIAKQLGVYIIPIGATGHLAKKIWDEIVTDPRKYYGGVDIATEFQTLGEPTASDDSLVQAVMKIVSKLR